MWQQVAAVSSVQVHDEVGGAMAHYRDQHASSHHVRFSSSQHPPSTA